MTAPIHLGSSVRFRWLAVAAALTALSIQNASGQTVLNFGVMHSFSAQAGFPLARLLQAADGKLYGTSTEGGFSGQGSVFVLTPDGAGGFSFATLHSFADSDGAGPTAGLIQGTDGNFYGTTRGGGQNVAGTVFRMDASGNVTTLHSFAGSDGAGPYAGLIQGTDGNFYGTTVSGGAGDSGTVFRMDASGNVTTLHSFAGSDGWAPYAGLVQGTDGNFYGTTLGLGGGASNAGTVFRIDVSGNLTTLHSFAGSDGNAPIAGLIQGTHGKFYGTTHNGGQSGNGTVFRMDVSGNLTTLHSFAYSDGDGPTAGLIQGADGNFYGTTDGGGTGDSGTVFRMDASGNVTTLHSFTGGDGVWPIAGLTQGTDGNFYGTTYFGGEFGVSSPGTVFRMDASGNVTTLHSFSYNDGAYPDAGLIQGTDGNFYGTTVNGGPLNAGTVFRMDASGNVTTLHSFAGSDGAGPSAGLIQGTDGSFYGTTVGGGERWSGTVFRMEASGNVTTLHSFAGSDGAEPFAGLVQGTDGNFYGTTYYGGAGNAGTVFRMDVSGNVTTLRSFAGSDGVAPYAGLIQGTDGNFYGTTPSGGAGNWGTVFRIDSSGNVTTLHSFSYNDGAYPDAGLIQATDGNFYGTTVGGASGWGTVFRIDASGNVTTLHSFSNNDGAYPHAGLIQGTDGNLYGTTSSGGAGGNGTVFRMDFSGNVITLHSFTGSDGAPPYAGLIQAANGSFYGTTKSGGPGRGGVVFRLATGVVTGNGPVDFSTDAGQYDDLQGVSDSDPSLPPKPPELEGYTFPYGLFSFRVVGLNPAGGDTITVTQTYPANIPVGAQYWKVVNGAWVNATSALMGSGDDGDKLLTLTLTDGGPFDGDSVPGQITDPGGIAIPSNAAPAVTSVTGPTAPIALGGSATVTANFTDANNRDTHTCTFSWGDGSPNAVVAAAGTGNGSCSATHVYAVSNVYAVEVTVTDNRGSSASSRFEFIVVYDAANGFVTGGGWINSPAGAYPANPSLTGKANFGFVSKYEHGSQVPTGNTAFNFRAGNLDFQSTSYDWLVISGAKARYRGAGRINGSGNYGFELTAWDGQVSGGGGVDKFRVKIWNQNQGNAVVYDNLMNAPDGADPTTVLGGGSIVIHR